MTICFPFPKAGQGQCLKFRTAAKITAHTALSRMQEGRSDPAPANPWQNKLKSLRKKDLPKLYWWGYTFHHTEGI